MKEEHIIPSANEEETRNRPKPPASENAAAATVKKAEVNWLLNDGNRAKQMIASSFSGRDGYQTSCHYTFLRGMERGLPPTRGRG